MALQGSHQACEGQGTEEGSASHLVTPAHRWNPVAEGRVGFLAGPVWEKLQSSAQEHLWDGWVGLNTPVGEHQAMGEFPWEKTH